MSESGPAQATVNARIVYWGVDGAGKRTNLEVIHQKLRPDHRGELRHVPTRLDPTVTSAMLPIELGNVGGVTTRIQIWTAPSGPEHAPSRQQILDQVDGVVFVADTTRDRIDDNLTSFEELRSALRAYGREIENVPLVIQYNKRDLGDPYALEELHRKLQMPGAAAFEAVASQGTAVLQTLTTISKRVIRHLREHPRQTAPPEAAAAPSAEPQAEPVTPPPGVTQILDGLAPAQEPEIDPAPSDPIPDAPDFELTDPMGTSVAPSQGVDPELMAAAPAASGVAAEAESLFEDGFQQDVAATAYDEPPADAEADVQWETVEIAAVGQAERADARTVRIPVTLRDESGRELRVSLSVRIDPLEPVDA